MRAKYIVTWVAALFLAGGAAADSVTWSDGRRWEGKIELGEGTAIRLHDGRQVQTWNPEEVQDIVFAPATQSMERAWVFAEAGKTAKQYSGEPYPTMELQSVVTLRRGESVQGHLLTTVFYLTREGRTEKLVLKFKLRGRDGQGFPDLVYPANIVFGSGESANPAAARAAPRNGARVSLAGRTPKAELAAVSRAKMVEADVRRVDDRTFRVLLDGGNAVVAAREGGQIAAGWRGDAPPAVRARLAQGLRDLRDFFDDRRLLAAAQDTNDATTCHTLLLLSRAGRTTYGNTASQPWRLEVWKWRLGEATNDVTAAARCVLFRGIREPGAPLPNVTISPALGRLDELADGTVWQVEEETR